MKIYNIKTIENFVGKIEMIADKLKIKLDYDQVSSNCFRIKLNLDSSRAYQRTSTTLNKKGNYRKVHAVCWHGYRDFLIELYKLNPSIRVVTAQATYNNEHHFNATYGATGSNNIGSYIEPMEYQYACLCRDSEAA
jgi:hypothetical protein